MDKRIITICVDNNTTQEQIKEIRTEFKNNGYHKDFILNILISGQVDMKDNIKEFLLSSIKF